MEKHSHKILEVDRALFSGWCMWIDSDKYILEKLKFLERHIGHVPSQQTCSVGTIFIHHHTCHYISRCKMFQCKCLYI